MDEQPNRKTVYEALTEAQRALAQAVRERLEGRHGAAAQTRLRAALGDRLKRARADHLMNSRDPNVDDFSLLEFTHMRALFDAEFDSLVPPLEAEADLPSEAAKELRRKLLERFDVLARHRNGVSHAPFHEISYEHGLGALADAETQFNRLGLADSAARLDRAKTRLEGSPRSRLPATGTRRWMPAGVAGGALVAVGLAVGLLPARRALPLLDAVRAPPSATAPSVSASTPAISSLSVEHAFAQTVPAAPSASCGPAPACCGPTPGTCAGCPSGKCVPLVCEASLPKEKTWRLKFHEVRPLPGRRLSREDFDAELGIHLLKHEWQWFRLGDLSTLALPRVTNQALRDGVWVKLRKGAAQGPEPFALKPSPTGALLCEGLDLKFENGQPVPVDSVHFFLEEAP